MPVEGSRFDAATWPPAVIGVKNLGYVNSASEPFYSRDIGRSFMLDGRIYYMFGDTFCNDAGISDNTYQVVPNIERPTEAFYLTSSANGHVAPLIKKTIEDDSFLAQPENRGKRLAFWCFGGVAEVSRGVGWLWYQKHVIGPGEEDILLGVGVARICVDSHTIDGALSCSRESFIPFKPDLPLFGSFSTLVEGNYVYLWGQIETDVYLARAPRTSCHQPFAYEYWNGHTYVDDVSACCRVFKDMQSGQIFRSDLFGAKLPWLFVGVSRFGDSVMRLGAAPRIEGPFDIQELFRAEGAKVTDRYTYCMYPHPWAAKNSKGKLLVTWCDPWPGGVLAAKVRFDGGTCTMRKGNLPFAHTL